MGLRYCYFEGSWKRHPPEHGAACALENAVYPLLEVAFRPRTTIECDSIATALQRVDTLYV